MEIITNIDHHIFLLINKEWVSPFLDAILVPVRHKLFWIPVYIFILLYIYYNHHSQRWFIYLSVAICILMSDTVSSKLIKKSVKRTRPCNIEYLEADIKVPCSKGYSFTSSHATNHFAISSFLFFLFFYWSYRWLLMAWAGLISYAQIYVGVHFPVDVIVGSVLGLIIGTLAFRIYLFLSTQFQNLKT